VCRNVCCYSLCIAFDKISNCFSKRIAVYLWSAVPDLCWLIHGSIEIKSGGANETHLSTSIVFNTYSIDLNSTHNLHNICNCSKINPSVNFYRTIWNTRFVALYSHYPGILGQIVFPEYIIFMVSAFLVRSLFEGNIYCKGMSSSVLFIYSCKVLKTLREYYMTKGGFHLFISMVSHMVCGVLIRNIAARLQYWTLHCILVAEMINGGRLWSYTCTDWR
jgi:hypothetical protein